MSSAGEASRGVGTGRGSRLPRWTRQEILVLIEGKRVVERSGRGRGRGRVRGAEGSAEPTKWAAVAEYCRRHGVDRGPVQCRKRWSNLAGDYKKIREWERGYAAKKENSFWAMRNDARRERRLPGFFDREVYDILEGRAGNAVAAAMEDAEGKEEAKAVLQTPGRGVHGSGLFSSSEDEDDQDDDAATPSPTPTPTLTPAQTPAPAAVAVPIPGEQAVPFFLEMARAASVSAHVTEKTTDVPRQASSEQGTSKEKQTEQITEDSPAQAGHKRQRSDDNASGRATTSVQGQLIEILDRSSQMVAAQLEAQNINSRLDREQRKDQVTSLHGVLGKVADALYRIADKCDNQVKQIRQEGTQKRSRSIIAPSWEDVLHSSSGLPTSSIYQQSDVEYHKKSEYHPPERLDSSDLHIQLSAAKRFHLGPEATIDSPSLNSALRNRVNSVTDTISAYDSRFEISLNPDWQTKTASTFQSNSQDSEITELFDHGHFESYSREDTTFSLGQTNKFTKSMQIDEPHSSPYKDVMAWIALGKLKQKGRLSHTCMQQAGQELLLGRDNIRQKVLEKMLLDSNGINNCTFICIYGWSGLGKTSLLHVLYNDQQLLDAFDKRIWIQISGKVDMVMFFRKILEFGMNEHCSIKNIDILRELVVEELTDKKFLLFLDDADIENQQFWTTVLEVLNTGAKGSVVVIATMSSTVAAVGNVATHSYSLNPLSEENNLMILQQYSGVGTDIQNNPDLVMLAKKFSSRFGSHPLNLKAISGLLCHADTISLENDMFGQSVTPLQLCYDALPVHLKRCLALCSLFPEGYIFDRHHMVLLWTSHGCVRPVEGYELEDVGIEYVNELLCRSFFQCSPVHSDKDDMFVMHELIYNVVASVSRDKYFKSKDLLSSIPENVLHCSLISSQFQTVELMHGTEQLKDLQTFLALQPEWKPNSISVPTLNLVGLDDFFLKFTSLEILDLSHTKTEELPGSIAGLRNLRYLSVNSTNIRALPSELCSLSNLQTLEAKHCRFLTELPSIKTLVKLRHLDLTKELGYVHLPRGIGELTELQTLPVFHFSEDSSRCSISELGNLPSLRGGLWLSGLGSVKTGCNAQEANLKDKHRLKDMTLQWHDDGINIEGEDEDEDEDTENVADEQVLEGLQPHANLQVLAIRGYKGTRFPAWMQGSSSLPNLMTLTLDNCCNCTEFPTIAHLPSLKFLSVRKMYGVQRLSSNRDTHGLVKFPSLELLNLWEMYSLEELFSKEYEGDCPRLRKVCISRCPNLKRLPCPPPLTELVLHCGHQLPDISELASLVSLKIEGFHRVRSFSLPVAAAALRRLEIRSCKELSSVAGLSAALTTVRRIKITGCPKLVLPGTSSSLQTTGASTD